ncbi:MAG: ribosomal protein S18-alanine N-acetyltransferase [Ruminococcus sp.]|nr:ribosomal protein S18-alanine N-acetyltransferase [Ruminococcus sp.]
MYEVIRASAETPDEIFAQMSELDRAYLGSEGWSPESFRSEAEKAIGYVLYIPDGEKVAAVFAGYHAAGEADITTVAVSEEYRRRGLGKMLIEGFLDLIPDDTESVFLEVRASNAPAAALYEKCGFSRISVRRRFYSDPEEDAVVMKLDLTDRK